MPLTQPQRIQISGEMVDLPLKVQSALDTQAQIVDVKTDLQNKDNSLKIFFDKYNDMATNGWQSVMALKSLRPDLISVVMAHSELDATGFARLKTVGKLLSEKMDFEGEFEMCFHTRVENGEYFFQTQHDGEHMARTPMEMFDEFLIPNDLSMIIDAVENYFNDEE